jgi:hypothetical protein
MTRAARTLNALLERVGEKSVDAFLELAARDAPARNVPFARKHDDVERRRNASSKTRARSVSASVSSIT